MWLCVCVRERESERDMLCVREREIQSVCVRERQRVCVCERERERERETCYVWERECISLQVCVCVCVCVRERQRVCEREDLIHGSEQSYNIMSWLIHPMTCRLTLNRLQKVWWSDVKTIKQTKYNILSHKSLNFGWQWASISPRWPQATLDPLPFGPTFWLFV